MRLDISKINYVINDELIENNLSKNIIINDYRQLKKKIIKEIPTLFILAIIINIQ